MKGELLTARELCAGPRHDDFDVEFTRSRDTFAQYFAQYEVPTQDGARRVRM